MPTLAYWLGRIFTPLQVHLPSDLTKTHPRGLSVQSRGIWLSQVLSLWTDVVLEQVDLHCLGRLTYARELGEQVCHGRP